MPLVFKISYKPPRGFSKARREPLVRRLMVEFENELLQKTLRDLTNATPVVTGASRRAWKIKFARFSNRIVRGSVTNRSFGVNALEYRTRPHFPPVGGRRGGRRPTSVRGPAMAVWIRRKLGIQDQKKLESVAFLISRAFSRFGSPTRLQEGNAAPSAGVGTDGRVLSWALFSEEFRKRTVPFANSVASKFTAEMKRVYEGSI